MKKIVFAILFCLPFAMYGKGGVPSSTYVSNSEQNRFALIAVGEMSSYCYRIDTKTGEVVIIDIWDGGTKTKGVRMSGNEVVNEAQSRNGRFQAYIAPQRSDFDILLIDTETGKIWQSNHKKNTLIEIPTE